MDRMYSVTVQATDSTNKVGMKTVMVEVTNVDEPGTVTLSALRPQSAIMFTATLTDPDTDGSHIRHYLAMVQGHQQEWHLQATLKKMQYQDELTTPGRCRQRLLPARNCQLHRPRRSWQERDGEVGYIRRRESGACNEAPEVH